MLKTVVALTAFGATAVRAFGSIPHPHPSPFSVCNPDPNVLVWDTTPVPGELKKYRGWLKVPILHEQPSLELLGEPLGFTAIRVAVSTKCAAGAKPILTHCGGPGSSNSCFLMSRYESAKHLLEDGVYDNFAITQRGIEEEISPNDVPFDPLDGQAVVPFFQEDGTTRVERFPTIKCKGWLSGSAVRAVNKAYEAAGRDFSAKEASMNEVLTAGPAENLFERLLVNDDAIELYAELTYAAQSECRKYPEYDLGTNVARGHMVYQDFMGTQDLARDLDDLRAAVGSEMLSVWGVSYGTEVAATYASVYPERIDKMIVDGNVAVSNDIYAAGELFALSLEQVWNGLAFGCNADYFLRGGDERDTLPADDLCAATPYPTQKMYDLIDDAPRETSLSAIHMITQALDLPGIGWHGVAPVGAMVMACVESLHKSQNFDGEGCCYKVGAPDTATVAGAVADIMNAPEDAYARSSQAVGQVGAVDMKDRLSPKDLVRFWQDLRAKHPLGYARARGILDIASMPNLPRPVPTYGSALDRVTPLVIGEFHDPATTYTAAQIMKDLFPNGALLSWQGYNHGTPARDYVEEGPASTNFMGRGYGASNCAHLLATYIETGELPINGHTCPINGPAANALKLEIAKDAVASGNCLQPRQTG